MLGVYPQNLSLPLINSCRAISVTRRLVEGFEVLGEEIVCGNGPFMRVKRWLRGVHPDQGVIVWGYTGWETLVEKDVVKPTHTFLVLGNPAQQVA